MRAVLGIIGGLVAGIVAIIVDRHDRGRRDLLAAAGDRPCRPRQVIEAFAAMPLGDPARDAGRLVRRRPGRRAASAS